MKILVAADGSPYTKRMLEYLAQHADWLSPQHDYTVVNAVSAVPPRAAAALDRSALKDYYQDEAERVFKPIRTQLRKRGIDAKFVFKTGPAGEVIAKLADSGGFELLVMGSRGHGSFGSLVMGSVATRVLAGCTTPVLLVR
jgi:nucleotide-binding universal stress UspA family protein